MVDAEVRVLLAPLWVVEEPFKLHPKERGNAAVDGARWTRVDERVEERPKRMDALGPLVHSAQEELSDDKLDDVLSLRLALGLVVEVKQTLIERHEVRERGLIVAKCEL